MGMDEIHVQMEMFEKELEAFNDRLRVSFRELKDSHERVNPLWQDHMRKEYDNMWVPVEEAMEDYLATVGRGHVEELINRVNWLRRYEQWGLM